MPLDSLARRRLLHSALLLTPTFAIIAIWIASTFTPTSWKTSAQPLTLTCRLTAHHLRIQRTSDYVPRDTISAGSLPPNLPTQPVFGSVFGGGPKYLFGLISVSRGYYLFGTQVIPVTVTHISLAIPLILTLPLAGLALAPWVRVVHSQRRRQLGLCPSCGYDIRATPDRCPECGTILKSEIWN